MTDNGLNILLTNDDGVNADGLLYLQEELQKLGSVLVVAPHSQKSASSHSISLNQSFQIAELDENRFALKGTPADCVMFAIKKMMETPPDIVVSGINSGPNLGDDIIYSGTVAGAREGSLNGILSFAFSLVSGNSDDTLRHAADFARKLISRILSFEPHPGSLFNVNIPEGAPDKFRFTCQGTKRFEGNIEEFIERGQGRVYRVTRGEVQWDIEPNTDVEAVNEKIVSVTPLHSDQTDYRETEYLIKKNLKKESPSK
jgi:5'/3'-nucleotidase